MQIFYLLIAKNSSCSRSERSRQALHFSLSTYTNQTQAELGLLVFCQTAHKLLWKSSFISSWTSHLFAQSALTCNSSPGFSEHFPCLGGGSRQLGTWFTSPGVVWTLFENTVYSVVNSFDCIRQILELDCIQSLHPLHPRRLFYPKYFFFFFKFIKAVFLIPPSYEKNWVYQFKLTYTAVKMWRRWIHCHISISEVLSIFPLSQSGFGGAQHSLLLYSSQTGIWLQKRK